MMPANPLKPDDDAGLLISFGNTSDGGGTPKLTNENSNPSVSAAKPLATKQPPSVAKPVIQSLMTQKSNSVAIAEQNEKKRVRKEQEDLEFQQMQAAKRVAEQKRKEQEAINKANAVNGLFGNSHSASSETGSGKGTGSGAGSGVQGNPAGKGTSGVGTTFKLGNRSYSGNPAKPVYSKDIEGKITVNIRVNESGIVTSTSIGSPTTISDSEMRREATAAANKTRFTNGTGVETGTITYNFRLE